MEAEKKTRGRMRDCNDHNDNGKLRSLQRRIIKKEG